MFSEQDIDSLRQQLRHRQQQLRELIHSSADTTNPVELDQSSVGRVSRMDAMQGQAMALERQRRNEIELGSIAAALQRIADGEYGCCETCGEDIALACLRSNPVARLCIDCARKNERR